MSILEAFIKGGVDEWLVQDKAREQRERDRLDRKREMAERQQLAAAERKQRRAERLEERQWAKEDRAELDNRKVIETFTSNGKVMERLGDGSTRVARDQTADELSAADLDRRYREAQIAAYNRGGSGGSDDEAAYKVDGDEALNILGFRSEEELEAVAEENPAVLDMYAQVKGRRLTQTQKDELRERLRARANAARRRDAQARRGAIIFDEGTGINLEDANQSLVEKVRTEGRK